ncbi:MAG: basic amino acid ABC transporter substrate-binding protein [Bacillota bacterium]
MFKKVVSLVLCIAVLVSLAACSSNKNSVEGIKKKGKIIMATEATFEPFEFRENNKIVGIDADIAAEIAKELGVELVIEEMEFGSLLAAVSNGKVDFIAAGLSIDEDRKKSVDFSDPYFNASQMIIVKEDSTIASKADLEGKKIGVQQGTTGDKEASNIKGATVERYTKTTDAVEALKQGKLDAIVLDNFPSRVFVSKNPGIKMLNEVLITDTYAIAVKKGNKELADTINAVLKRLKDSGELENIINKYSAALGGA